MIVQFSGLHRARLRRRSRLGFLLAFSAAVRVDVVDRRRRVIREVQLADIVPRSP